MQARYLRVRGHPPREQGRCLFPPSQLKQHDPEALERLHGIGAGAKQFAVASRCLGQPTFSMHALSLLKHGYIHGAPSPASAYNQIGPPQATKLQPLPTLRVWARQAGFSAPGSAATRAWALARTVPLAKAEPHWQELAGRLREVLRGMWRASRRVECINSVARMRQGRRRKMT